MAVKPFTTTFRADGVRVLFWEGVTENDTCAPVILMGLEGAVGDLQAVGTFGSASVALQGSNDQATYAALNDQNGDAIALSAEGAADFSTAMLQIRPHPTGGSSQDLDLYLCLREGR
ncbi:MAG: hypothetical protein KDK24_09935 [Pseudooceanicola sp.]|nr:hypothetical protein [Pseudooceanicola sp.]